MGFISAAQGQPYMSAVSAIAVKLGDWIPIGDGAQYICFEYVFAMGAGNITGSITIEHTASQTGGLALTAGTGTRVMLPLGSLHTASNTLATLDLAPNPSLQVTLTAMVTGRLTIMIGDVPPGQIKSNFNWVSGTGASPNTVTVYASGRT